MSCAAGLHATKARESKWPNVKTWFLSNPVMALSCSAYEVGESFTAASFCLHLVDKIW